VKIRTLLTAGAAAAVATAAALAAPGIASAANGPAPAINVVQTASPASFNSSSGTVATGTVSGVIPARGSSLKKNAALAPASAGTSHAAAAVPCGTEPDCHLPYGGGPVQHTPHVYLVFWGPKWGTNTATENFVKSFFTDLGQPSDYWSTAVEQYGDKTGHPAFGKGLLVSTYWDKNTPEKNVTDNNLGTEAAAAVSWLHITDPNDADVVIAAQQGTCFSAPAGDLTFAGNGASCAQPSPSSGYCAFHDWDINSANSSLHLPWVNLPYQPDAGVGCGQTFINTPGTNDGYPITGGHELMEAITDPIGTGWVDNADNVSGGEVADKCAWGGQLWGDSDPAGNVKVGPGTFAMQSLWSNATGGCVMNGGLPLSVTTPATQTATLGKAVSLKITASIGGATPLTYTASGLPGGLSINRSTGLISGAPNVTAGTFTSKVTVAYYAGWRTIAFGWHVSSLAGEMKGYDAKCLGDYNGSTTVFNKIVIWTCTAGAAQNITFAANSELLVVGGCVTGTTATAVLGKCAGATSQEWTRLSNGEYVLKSNGKCLTAPSATNGRQLTLAACANTANQHWAWP
jgi:serine protease